jgi:hypothetical protein
MTGGPKVSFGRPAAPAEPTVGTPENADVVTLAAGSGQVAPRLARQTMAVIS